MVSQGRVKLIVFVSVLVSLLSIGGLIALIIVWHQKLTPFTDFAIVVDAGSTHSKIFVYQWPSDKSDGLGTTSRINQTKTCSVKGGPITSVTDPTEDTVRDYFQSAMSDCLNNIVQTRRSRAMIFLGGTAGLRLSEMSNANYTHSLLDSTRAYFKSLGVHIPNAEQQVRIINGSEEGLSGWISTNMLMDQLFEKHDPENTYGVSDMGGASTQLSFTSKNAKMDWFTMNLFNADYSVYSHSYLCYGTEQIRWVYLANLVNQANGSAVTNDPCLQNGYVDDVSYDEIFGTPCARGPYAPLSSLNTSSTYSFVGTGNSATCLNAVLQHFNTSVCSYDSCSFDDVYQPKPISSTMNFIAISAWYSVFKTLSFNVSLAPDADGNYRFDTVTFDQIKHAIGLVCNQSWGEIINPDKYRPFLCFNSMYHWTLLEHGYSMNDTNLKNLRIVDKINGNDIGWTLGYMINQTNAIPPDQRPPHLLTKSEFGGLVFLCSALLLISTLVFVFAMRQFWKNRRD